MYKHVIYKTLMYLFFIVKIYNYARVFRFKKIYTYNIKENKIVNFYG